jgi:hypothetical protein
MLSRSDRRALSMREVARVLNCSVDLVRHLERHGRVTIDHARWRCCHANWTAVISRRAAATPYSG